MPKFFIFFLSIFSLLGCDYSILIKATYKIDIEGNNNINAQIYLITSGVYLLVIHKQHMGIDFPTLKGEFINEAYYIDTNKEIVGLSSMIKYEIIDSIHAKVNNTAIEQPPIMGLYKADFQLVNNGISIFISDKVIPEDVNLSEIMTVYRKKITLTKE